MKKTQQLYDLSVPTKNGPGTIAPRLIGHGPIPQKPKREPKYKYKPKSEVKQGSITGNPEGGKELFDLVYICFLGWLVWRLLF